MISSITRLAVAAIVVCVAYDVVKKSSLARDMQKGAKK